MKKVLYIIIIIILIALLTVYMIGRNKENQSLEEINIKSTTSPVILLIIDSLMDKPMQEAISEGKAPALKFLLDNGQYYSNLISSYPTMSVSIDSTLLTGKYPNEHKVPGLVWFDEKDKRIINYGSAIEEIVKLGMKNVFEDHFYRLNHQHLSPHIKTIHEELAENNLQSGSINALIYRGTEKNTLYLSDTLANFDIMTDNLEFQTPPIFSYGAFAQYNPKNKKNTQLWERYGFNDKFSTEEIKYIIENDKLPALTVVYFSDLDQEVHKKGPDNHLEAIRKVDQQLQEVLNSYNSWEEALDNKVWMVMGDSGQAPVLEDKDESLIPINDLLDAYIVHQPEETVSTDDQLVLALNERMSYIYNLDDTIKLEDIALDLLVDQRISFTAWRNSNGIEVANSENKRLFFEPEGGLVDPYGQNWTIEWDKSVLDLTIDRNKVNYGEFPDALARLYGALNSHEGNFLVVDAKPGYEFIGDGTPTHPGGGSHGSLHESDSIVPLIITGTKTKPQNERIIDMKSWIEEIILK